MKKQTLEVAGVIATLDLLETAALESPEQKVEFMEIVMQARVIRARQYGKEAVW